MAALYNRTCFYGVCLDCRPNNLICADDSNFIEGSLVVYLPASYKLQSCLHPWRRTYAICNSIFAKWETDANYCTSVRTSGFFGSLEREASFLDIIDGSVFDFLIDNGDRHHFDYHVENSVPRMVLLDNGKSFANPYVDHTDILAPLYQCCLLRNSTWNVLLELRGGNLSYWLRQLLVLDSELVFPEMHFRALDRRLLIIFALLEDCFQRKGKHNVIVSA